MRKSPSAKVHLKRSACKPCEGGVRALPPAAVRKMLKRLAGWSDDGAEIARTYEFRNHYEVMAFVNAIAWISHREDHHPDLEVGYNTVRVRYSTHSIGGLSRNDFICAAKVEELLK